MAAVDDSQLQRESLEVEGEVLEVLRSPDMADCQWAEYKAFLQAFPDEAKRLLAEETNPDMVRRRNTLNMFTETWRKLMDDDQDDFAKKIRALEEESEFKPLFDDMKAYRWDAVALHLDDRELMMKVSRRMGGVPREAKLKAERIRKHPLTLQEGCKFGDIKALQRYLSETEHGGREIDALDHRGVTCLGYAVGANRMAIAKLLIDAKADPTKVDDREDSALHFAATYGRKDMVEYFLSLGLDMDAKNVFGRTPLECATINKQKATMQLLSDKGAQ